MVPVVERTIADGNLRADARRNREAILAAAKHEFTRHGLDAQMDQIAARAGLGVGTVYRHFPTKDALLGGLVREKFALFVAHAHQVLAEGGEPFEQFAALLARNAEAMAQDVSLQQVLMGASVEVWGAAAAERAALEALAAPLLDAAREAGTLRADFRVEEVGMLMSGVCTTMAAGSPHGGDWRRHLQIVLDGLKSRGGSDR